MPKKDKIEDISIKDFQKMMDDIKKLESGLYSVQDMPKSMQNLNEQFKKIKNKFDEYKDTNKTVQNVSQQLINTNEEISNLKKEIAILKKDIYLSQERIEQTIKTQEEIIMDMISKFNEELLNHKSSVLEDIQKLKTQQDVLKISNTVNDKKLIAKIENIVQENIKDQLQGKENELLMKTWINDFKEIFTNFDKLKALTPKEFALRLNQISEILDIYKEKLQNYV